MCAAARTMAEPILSPDADTVVVVVTTNGRAALHLVPVDGGPERVLTTEPTPRSASAYGGGLFAWAPDGQALVYVAEGDLWRVATTGGPPVRITNHGPDRPAGAPAVSPHGDRVAYVVDQRDVAVTGVDPQGPWPVRLSRGNDFALDPTWSADGKFVAWHEWDVPAMSWDESRWSLAPADGSGMVATMGEPGVQRQQPRFAPVGSDLSYLCDASGWLNLWVFGPDRDNDRPLVDEPFEHGYPAWSFGQRSTAWSPDGTSIAFTRNESGFGRLCVVDIATRGVTEVAKGLHSALSWQGDRIVALRSGAVTPPQLVTYDTTRWERRVLAHTAPLGLEATAVEPTEVSWPAEDGETVHGLYYAPPNAAGPPPLIVWVHGGPTGQWQVDWRVRVSYFRDQGWAVLAVNHRGSTGFGRAYTQAMRERWGELDVADAAAGMRAAADNGWGDPRAMVPMGGSAGGFTVLHLLGRYGELCAAGVALSAVADLFDLDERGHRFERHYNHSLIGPLPEAAARYAERSPVTFADRITVPLLLLHGSADDVVPVEQSTRVAAAITTAGGTVEHHVYDGEGHGWGRPATVVDELERTDDFLRRHVLRWRA
jgi:dipeptidyl aminopeptidase/acylaminoacyl peptidase